MSSFMQRPPTGMEFGPPGDFMGGGGGPPRGGGGGFGGIGAPGGIGLFSLFAALFTRSNATESIKLLLYGLAIEFGRKLYTWASERVILQPSVSARFMEGDPAYEWIMHYLTQENVWRKSRDFDVNARSTKRRWHVNDSNLFTAALDGADNADYVPKWDKPHVFRWRGYWVDVIRVGGDFHGGGPFGSMPSMGQIRLTFFTGWTLKVKLLADFVEETRRRYLESNRPRVTIHLSDSHMIGRSTEWGNVKTKARRPLSTLALESGVMERLLADVKEFIDVEEWYTEAGIPHHRGYLLYGPPGTGKTSTIYALAGELGLEIYSLSLAASHIDDAYLQRLAASVPRGSILLIEDIDCAFPSREDEDEAGARHRGRRGAPAMGPMPMGMGFGGGVTLSGLLNVIDGVGSDDGRIFFATTNHYDRLDPALVRPGRVDVKIEYKKATSVQARALFSRFFPESRFEPILAIEDTSPPTVSAPGLRRRLVASTGLAATTEKASTTPASTPRDLPYRRVLDVPLDQLAEQFASVVPPYEFSAAELQGYLLTCKWDPVAAANGLPGWMDNERRDRADRERREAERAQKAAARENGLNGAGGGYEGMRGLGVPPHFGGPSGGGFSPPMEFDGPFGLPPRSREGGRGRGWGGPGSSWGNAPPPPPPPRGQDYDEAAAHAEHGPAANSNGAPVSPSRSPSP